MPGGRRRRIRQNTTCARDAAVHADETAENLYLTMYKRRPGIISIFNEWPIQRLAQNTSLHLYGSAHRDGWIDVAWPHYTHVAYAYAWRTAWPNTHVSIHSNYTVCVHFNWTIAPRKLTVKTCNRFQKLYADECRPGQSALQTIYRMISCVVKRPYCKLTHKSCLNSHALDYLELHIFTYQLKHPKTKKWPIFVNFQHTGKCQLFMVIDSVSQLQYFLALKFLLLQEQIKNK